MHDQLQPDATVSAAAIGRKFGDWQSRALQSPVTITHHGRARFVLSSVEHFHGRLERTSSADYVKEAREVHSQFRAVLNQLQESFLAFDHHMIIIDTNPSAELFVGIARDELIGRDLRSIFPETDGSIVWDFYRRVIKTGMSAEFTMTSAIRFGERVRLKAFPYDGGGVAVLFTNLAPAEEARVLKARSDAVSSILQQETNLSVLRLNSRGGIEAIDDAFIQLSGFAKSQLLGMMFTDLVRSQDRNLLARSINAAVKDGETRTVTVGMVHRTTSDRQIRLSMRLTRHDNIPEEVAVLVVDLSADPQ